MARRGRPPKGPDLVDALDASEDAKARAKIFLQSIQGTLSAAEASARLGVSETRFHEMRTEWLAQATALLEPKPRGRPPAPEPSEEAKEIQRLKAQMVEMAIDLKAAQIREKVMLIAPHLLDKERQQGSKKKKRGPATGSGGGTSSTPSSSAGSSGTST